jgi:hypothetical protein
MLAPIVPILASLAVIIPANGAVVHRRGGHTITFTNKCAQTVTPMLTNTGGPFIKLKALKKGGTASTTVPDNVGREIIVGALVLTFFSVALWPCFRSDRSLQPA